MNRSTSLLLVAAMLSLPAAGLAQAPDASLVERLLPAADSLLGDESTLQRVASCCEWLEGPAWSPDGRLFAVDTNLNELLTFTPEGKMTVFKKPAGLPASSGFTGKEPGTNGNAFDSDGRLTSAGHALRNVLRYDHLAGESSVTVLADRYRGKRLNSPNDLVYASDGSLYFTDPPYGLATQSDTDPKKELPFNGVFLIRHATSLPEGGKPAAPVLILRNLTRPNGIALSPDEKTLYIAVSDPANPVWMRYPRHADGTVGAGRVLLSSKGAKGDGGPDGMRVDSKGNIYGAGPGGVWIISPEGAHLATIHVPERVGNVAFGGSDRRTLYIAGSSSIYRLRVKVPGPETAH